jgi:Domain of unknown function (DUF5666)
MKKLFVLVFVIALLAVTAMPALAEDGPIVRNRFTLITRRDGNGVISLAGTITSLDSSARTVNVKVASGNRLAKPYLGKDVTILTTNATRFLLRNPDGSATPITFAELIVGQKVSVYGGVVDNVLTASRITVGARLARLP